MKWFFIAALLVVFNSWGQSNIYSDEYKSLNSLSYEVSTTKVIKVNSIADKVQIYTIKNGEVYLGRSNSYFDCVYKVSNNQIFKGRNRSTFDVQYTLEEGKLYKGEGGFPNKVVYTFQDGKVFLGDSNSIFDLIATYDLEEEQHLIYIALTLAPL